tara:strand:- start:723 stop:881 length:159 start_codon:yes stop_codon:yes gene_type:complete
MKQLENYGVQELNAREIKSTDGGLIGVLFLCTLLIAGPMLGWASGRKSLGQP